MDDDFDADLDDDWVNLDDGATVVFAESHGDSFLGSNEVALIDDGVGAAQGIQGIESDHDRIAGDNLVGNLDDGMGMDEGDNHIVVFNGSEDHFSIIDLGNGEFRVEGPVDEELILHGEALGFADGDIQRAGAVSSADVNQLHKDGFGEDGFDRNGLDRDGFSRDGFHVQTGLDSEGFGRDGFNELGVDRKGSGETGFTRKQASTEKVLVVAKM